MNKAEELDNIGRRVMKSLEEFEVGDYESCSIHLWPALDHTAKRRHGGSVKARIIKFLREYGGLMSYLSTSNIFDIEVDGITLAECLYRDGRTFLMHEGKQSPNLQWNTSGEILLFAASGPEGIQNSLPASYLLGMIVSVICAPENKTVVTHSGEELSFFDLNVDVDLLWGQEDFLYSWISDRMGRKVTRSPV